ncbi:MAG: hypothetical protein U1G08_01465 [Verrucomicrobiota bacterium]
MPIRIAAALAGLAFLILIGASLLALRGIRRGRRDWRWPALALLTLLISAAGVWGRTPWGSFPEVVYVRTEGASQIMVRSGWCFYLPLVVSGVGLLLYFARRNRPNPSQEATQRTSPGS